MAAPRGESAPESRTQLSSTCLGGRAQGALALLPTAVSKSLSFKQVEGHGPDTNTKRNTALKASMKDLRNTAMNMVEWTLASEVEQTSSSLGALSQVYQQVCQRDPQFISTPRELFRQALSRKARCIDGHWRVWYFRSARPRLQPRGVPSPPSRGDIHSLRCSLTVHLSCLGTKVQTP